MFKERSVCIYLTWLSGFMGADNYLFFYYAGLGKTLSDAVKTEYKCIRPRDKAKTLYVVSRPDSTPGPVSTTTTLCITTTKCFGVWNSSI